MVAYGINMIKETFRVPPTLDRDQSGVGWHKGNFRVPSTLSLDREWWKMAYTVLTAQGLIIYGPNNERFN